uniref:Putative E3 ubiquitin-protein ligase LIN ARM-like domain-containing protein n=2 Tax=Kalanchoe fedtschenkoi TaxID=63787 RepID=A0A7N0UHD0_KALFE
MDPKDAAIALTEQILIGGDENSRNVNAVSVISGNMLPHLVKCLDGEDGRETVISILLCCMHADKSCKNLIAYRIELSSVLELLHKGNDTAKAMCVEFVAQLVQLNRRIICNKILQTIRDEGAFSTMHTLLVHLQMAPMEQQPVIATLLLQLDLLVEPRKMSIYREEAIEALIEALRRVEFPYFQAMALDALVSLCGHVTASGKSYTEALLLKIAGFDQPYTNLMTALKNDLRDEADEKAASLREERVAFVLGNYEKGSVFKALEECFKSNSLKMAKTCLVMATWLTYMIYKLPDTCVREVARTSLLHQFINVLRSSKNLEEKVFATLALKSFISDKGALEEQGVYAKSIFNVLRKLRRSSTAVTDILKALINLPSVNVVSSIQGMCSRFGMLQRGNCGYFKKFAHTPKLLHVSALHLQATSCTVWEIYSEEIRSLEVHEVKESVYALTANSNVACFASHVTALRQVNMSKHVRSLALVGDKVYCGCNGYAIQEVDLLSFTVSTFYSGSRNLLGKQNINALDIHEGRLYAGGISLSNRALTGSFSTHTNIQQVSINNDYIFTSTKCGIIEVWLKERVSKVASIEVGGGNAKITDMGRCFTPVP